MEDLFPQTPITLVNLLKCILYKMKSSFSKLFQRWGTLLSFLPSQDNRKMLTGQNNATTVSTKMIYYSNYMSKLHIISLLDIEKATTEGVPCWICHLRLKFQSFYSSLNFSKNQPTLLEIYLWLMTKYILLFWLTFIPKQFVCNSFFVFFNIYKWNTCNQFMFKYWVFDFSFNFNNCIEIYLTFKLKTHIPIDTKPCYNKIQKYTF